MDCNLRDLFLDLTDKQTLQKVPGHHHRYSSTLTWLSREGDIGLLLCRATNSFGEQKRPCSYTISPGGPPIAPDCEVLRSYPNALRVQCKKGKVLIGVLCKLLQNQWSPKFLCNKFKTSDHSNSCVKHLYVSLLPSQY